MLVRILFLSCALALACKKQTVDKSKTKYAGSGYFDDRGDYIDSYTDTANSDGSLANGGANPINRINTPYLNGVNDDGTYNNTALSDIMVSSSIDTQNNNGWPVLSINPDTDYTPPNVPAIQIPPNNTSNNTTIAFNNPRPYNSIDFYNAELGKKFASRILSATGSYSQGLCYPYVANYGLIWPFGFHDNRSCDKLDLNCNEWALSFAKHWKQDIHGPTLKLKTGYLKPGFNINGESVDLGFRELDAPVGSVLVWSPCNARSSDAGHIAIVTEKGSKAASDFVQGLVEPRPNTQDPPMACEPANLVAIFIPTY